MKTLSGVLSLILVASQLAACGGGGGSSAAQTPTTVSGVALPTQVSAVTAK